MVQPGCCGTSGSARAFVRAEYEPRRPLEEEINRLARRFKVSTLVVLRRIHDAGGLPQDQFWRAYRGRTRTSPSDAGGERRRFLSDARRSCGQTVRTRTGRQHIEGKIVLHGGVSAARIQENGDVSRGRAQPRRRRLMAYLLDANVFISAKNLHYGFDFCPAFWDWIIARTRAAGYSA